MDTTFGQYVHRSLPPTRRIEDTYLRSVRDHHFWGDDRVRPEAPQVRAVAATACAKEWTRECAAMSHALNDRSPDRINDLDGLSEGEKHIRRTAEAKWGNVQAGPGGCSVAIRYINPHNPALGYYGQPVGDCRTVIQVKDPEDLESKQMSLCLEKPYLCPQVLESACALREKAPAQNGPVYRRLQGYCQYHFNAGVRHEVEQPLLNVAAKGRHRFDHIPFTVQ